MRVVLFALLAAFLFAAPLSADPLPQSQWNDTGAPFATAPVKLDGIDFLRFMAKSSEVKNAACCKVCRKGKACGDSCIRRSYTCRKGPGCACDG